MTDQSPIDTTNATSIPATDPAVGFQAAAKAKGNATDIATHKVPVTFLQDEFGSSMNVKEMTLPELSALIQRPRGRPRAN